MTLAGSCARTGHSRGRIAGSLPGGSSSVMATYHIDRCMAQQHPGKAVAQFKPRVPVLQAQIRKAAEDSRNVSWSIHAEERMEEREITLLDALRVLRTGDIVGDIEPGKSVGEWKCKVVARKKGSRAVGVVSVVLRSGRLMVKTVEWEDA